jgi:hypothetical protein
MAEYLLCPKCGKRVDEDDQGNETPIPVMAKEVAPPLGLAGPASRSFTFAYCQHCGTVLGIAEAEAAAEAG